jgi:hypothetical protein
MCVYIYMCVCVYHCLYVLTERVNLLLEVCVNVILCMCVCVYIYTHIKWHLLSPHTTTTTPLLLSYHCHYQPILPPNIYMHKYVYVYVYIHIHIYTHIYINPHPQEYLPNHQPGDSIPKDIQILKVCGYNKTFSISSISKRSSLSL